VVTVTACLMYTLPEKSFGSFRFLFPTLPLLCNSPGKLTQSF